jgi:tetratricopeptide (TPR) repeat protein
VSPGVRGDAQRSQPGRAALARAERHSREGCRLNPVFGDAWGTLAMVRHRQGAGREAIAAARSAVELEPQEWRHHLRLAFVSWGAERLSAANRVLALCPGLALGHWFAATVFTARGAFDTALGHLRAGCAAQDLSRRSAKGAKEDAQRKEGARFAAAGLHYLHGLVLGATGQDEAAEEELRRELAFEARGHIYDRECAAHCWYALGAMALRRDREDEARNAFSEALNRVPGHHLAAAGLAAASGAAPPAPRPARGEPPFDPMQAALVEASVLALRGKHAAAARTCERALEKVRGSDGWILPVEPILNRHAHADVWTRPLAILRERAA